MSDIMVPLLIPTYCIIIALWLTPMRILPWGTRALSAMGVFFLTTVIPYFALYIMIKTGKVSDVSISDRRQRPVPFLIGIACYALNVLYLGLLHAPRWILLFFVASAVVAVVELLVSFVWKISAHAAAIAGMLGFVAWLAARNALIWDSYVILSVAIFLAGLVCWARLLLQRHTLGQVAAGAALGFGVISLFLWL